MSGFRTPITPKPKCTEPFRVDVGGSECKKPYSASVLNISAMSFGALGEKCNYVPKQGC